MRAVRLSVPWLVLLASVARAEERPKAEIVDLSAPEAQGWFRTDWYGVYAGDVKVGWMRRSLERGKRGDEDVVAREIGVLIDVAGDGNGLETSARTVYSCAPPQSLVEAASVVVEGGRRTAREVVHRDGRMDVVTVRRGERVEGSVAPLPVTLADEVAAERLALLASGREGGAAGASLESGGIDLSSLSASRRVLSVSAARVMEDGSREFDVTATSAVRARETFTTDGGGALLRGSLGPRFTFRREAEAAATDPAFRTALEERSRIPLDVPLGDVAALRRLVLAWEEAAVVPFPQSPRQRATRTGTRLVLTVERDADCGVADEDACTAALLDDEGFDLADPMIREGAARVASGSSTRSVQVGKFLEFVRDHVRDERVLGTLPAGEILRRPRGDATEHARLFAALCRSAGIPAREVHGLAWLGDEKRAFGRHTWVEVALDGKWRPVDPTTGQNPADAGHVATDPAPLGAASLLGARFVLVAKE